MRSDPKFRSAYDLNKSTKAEIVEYYENLFVTLDGLPVISPRAFKTKVTKGDLIWLNDRLIELVTSIRDEIFRIGYTEFSKVSVYDATVRGNITKRNTYQYFWANATYRNIHTSRIYMNVLSWYVVGSNDHLEGMSEDFTEDASGEDVALDYVDVNVANQDAKVTNPDIDAPVEYNESANMLDDFAETFVRLGQLAVDSGATITVVFNGR